MMKISLLLAPAVVAAVVPVSIPKSWSPRERAAAEAVTESALKAHVKLLADDLLEGRGAGSRGDALAMRYVAAEYERLGLEPAGDAGGYLQKFDLVGMKSELTAPPVFKGAAGAKLELKPPVEAIVAPGQQKEALSVSDAEVVFVGYGITAPEQKWDDWKGVDVKGKIVMVMNSDPEGDPALFAGKTRLYYGRWSYKYEEAARQGAAGVIIIHTEPSAAYPWQVVRSSWGGEMFELPAKEEKRLTVKMWATEESSRKIAALGGKDLDQLRKVAETREFRPVALGVKLSVGLKTKVRKLETANVLGRLAGSDAALAKELVVITAHHDHLGIGEPKNGDAIYNGALDNATGVAALLASAEGMVMGKARPKRSILFAAVAAEESGLIGSEYLCAHAPVPVGRIAANLNVDGFNIWGRSTDTTFVGLGKSTLDEVVKKVAKEQGREVVADQFPEKGVFYRSDQFNFAKVGVPAAYLKGGTHFVGHDAQWGLDKVEEYVKTRYHQPSDQVDGSWVFDGAVDDVRLLTVVALRIADLKGAPVWNKGDEFEAVRMKALGELK